MSFTTFNGFNFGKVQTQNVSAGGGAVGGWKELGRTTLGSNSATINISSLPNKRYYMYLIHGFIGSRFIESRMQFNSDSGSNYAYRVSNDGGADVSGGNASNILIDGIQTTQPRFQMGYVSNYSTKEKLQIGWSNIATTGAGTAPQRNEVVNKWANTSNSINAFNLFTSDTVSDNYGTGSEMVVLGYDPSDTHTSNFWEELASVELSSTNSVLDSGTFTAKKYLWIQCYLNATTVDTGLTFNSDTSANYAVRTSDDGGADGTAPSNSHIQFDRSNKTQFGNIFIINNNSSEKIGLGSVVTIGSAGAGNAPARREYAFKWANTSSQITNMIFTVKGGGTNLLTGSILKVYGSN